MLWKDHLVALNGRSPHPAWGPAHCRRVYALSLELARLEGWRADEDALFAAAFLHDLSAFAPYRHAGVDHAQRAAELAPDWLTEAGYPTAGVATVQEIILGHMFSAAPPASPEARVFHDADTLEFMGAVGVARVLAIVGIDDWTPDLPSAIRLLQRFALELPPALLTDAGRTLGAERSNESKAFLTALANETQGLAAI